MIRAMTICVLVLMMPRAAAAEWHFTPMIGETFLGRMMHTLLFHDFPDWVFGAIYYVTLAVVLLTLVLCRPRWPFGRKEAVAA